MKYIPITPGGTVLSWLAQDTEEAAWKALMQDAAHMPYRNQAGFEKRGYTVEKFVEVQKDDAVSGR